MYDGFCYVRVCLCQGICIPNHFKKMHSSAAFKECQDSKVTVKTEGWNLGSASFQLHKQAKQLVWISLTHRYAPLPSTSKQLKLKVGEKVMGGKKRAQRSDFKRERKLRPGEWDRASWNSRLMQCHDWLRFILLQKYSVQRPCDEFLQPPGKERLSFALMFFYWLYLAAVVVLRGKQEDLVAQW